MPVGNTGIDLTKWYWFVGNKSDVQVFSSPAAGYVSINDPGYQAWCDETNPPRTAGIIACDGELAHVFWQNNLMVLCRAAGTTSMGPEGGITPQDAIAMFFAIGLELTSTGESSLNGLYALDNSARSNIVAEQLYIATAGSFTNGQPTKNWYDVANAAHLFDMAHFTDFAKAAGRYGDALITWGSAFAADPATPPPSNAYTIA